MTHTLVTGGSGFVGHYLVEALVAQGHEVRVLDLHPPVRATAQVQFVQGSVLDPATVRQSLDGIDQVYHLAALPGMWMPDKNDFHAVNSRGTEIVIDAARKSGVSRFLHCSTESILFSRANSAPVVTEQTRTSPAEMPGAYTRSKMIAEQHALQAAAAGFPLVIANPTMPIGPHQRLTPPTLMLQYFLNRRVQIYYDFVMNLVDVRDVAAGLILVMRGGQVGQRYILGGEDISLRKLLDILAAISGRDALRIPIPGGFAQATAVIMDFIADHVSRRPPAATVEGVRIALWSKPLSIDKSRRELGYQPHPIEPALRETIASIHGNAH